MTLQQSLDLLATIFSQVGTGVGRQTTETQSDAVVDAYLTQLEAQSGVIEQVADSGVMVIVKDMLLEKYLFITPNVFQLTGFPSEVYLRDGFAASFSRMRDQDRQVTVELLQRVTAAYAEIPPACRASFTMAFLLRLTDPQGKIRTLQQRLRPAFVYPDGSFRYSFSVYVDVGPVSDAKFATCAYSYLEGGQEKTFNIALQTSPAALLSPRELEILNLLANGHSSKAAADILNISPNTLNTHRRNMLSKTGCKNITELSAKVEKGLQ